MRNISKRTMKFILIALIFLVNMQFSLLHVFADSIEDQEINIDLNNDSTLDKVIVSQNSIKIFKCNENKSYSLSHEFKLNPVKFSNFDQYNIIDNRSQMISGQDIRSPFAIKHDTGNIRYDNTQNVFFKEKFIIANINKDKLLDFIIIEEPNAVDYEAYKHLIYYQIKDSLFSNAPNRIIEEKWSSWITGIYYDIGNEGLPDKIEIRYKNYGALLSNTKSIVSIYHIDKIMNGYKKSPDMQIVSSGVFYEKSNLVDINNDGYPDILIVNIPKKPKSIEEAISKILNRQINIDLKFYLYDKRAKSYPLAPSFIMKTNIDILQDFSISLDNDYNHDGYKDILITQSDCSKKYLFDPQECQFSKTQLK